MNDLTTYVAKVAEDINATWPTFARFARPGVITYPIPFFGDIESAQVLTVGPNPSASEFVGRKWPVTMNPATLTERLISYFTNASVPPYHWFDTWSESLACLGLSYRYGAAHVDLSPRATVAMGSPAAQADVKGFWQMIEMDAKWFFQILPLCRSVRALLIAGTVTKRWWINDFIARIAPFYHYQLSGQAESTDEGRVGFLRLTGPGCDLPVFYYSVSPSHNTKKHLLVKHVCSHRATIKKWLD